MKALNCALATRQDLLRTLPRGLRVAEVGVFAGAFAKEILAICEPSELHLIDTWRGMVECGDQHGRNVVRLDTNLLYDGLRRVFANTPSVTLHREASARALARFADDHFDFIYIDADHAYESVVADLWMAARKCRGAVGGHDYCSAFPGVMRAVDEMCAQEGWSMTYLTDDGCPSYLLERVRA